MVNENESLFVVSVTEVAVIVGFAAAPVGRVVGGVYVAEKLGDAAGTNVPQSGLHAAPFAVNAQVTPALTESFGTLAFTANGGPPMAWDTNLLVIKTEIGGGTIVKLKEALAEGTAAEIAEMVGLALAPVGSVVGGR